MNCSAYETDWLASRPVFYNEVTGKVSHNINEVIDFANLEFDPEGFNNYLDFGYAVFGQTPVKNVKFLPHSSRLCIGNDGKLQIQQLEDPVKKWLGRISHEEEILELLYNTVRNWESSVDGEIIVPTSGGYDSRLLNALIKDKSRVRAFTYGVSPRQYDSSEVVFAKKVSEILGTRWEWIPLGDFHRYLEEWDQEFGISTHAHGMYHIEFYRKITARVQGRNPLLSGIIGDAWAGSVKIPKLDSPAELNRLGYTHGIRIDPSMSLFKHRSEARESYYLANKELLESDVFRLVEAMRFKIILLNYLVSIPIAFGFKAWSPFLDESIAMGMATLPSERRRDRIWQRDFFKKHGLDVESLGLKSESFNELDLHAQIRQPLPILDSARLREVINPDYVDWINRTLKSYASLRRRLVEKNIVSRALRRISYRNSSKSKALEAYNAYLVLRPIQNLIMRRELNA